MKVLGIETATAVCAAALLSDGRIAAEEAIASPQAHSEKLLILVDRCLRHSGVSLRSLDLIAVSIGPGSFTGLRIGLSSAKGLAAAADLPLVAVPTLHALAWKGCMSRLLPAGGGFVFPMIDARRDEVYCALYRTAGGTPEELLSARAATVKECAAIVPREGIVLFLGDGAEKFIRSAAPEERFLVPPEEFRRASASSVAFLGEQMFSRGMRADLASLEPLYVKDFYTLVTTQHREVTA
jgi:tRNA threonylcarbamoyladenosine biosynthesis protein TsaB